MLRLAGALWHVWVTIDGPLAGMQLVGAVLLPR